MRSHNIDWARTVTESMTPGETASAFIKGAAMAFARSGMGADEVSDRTVDLVNMVKSAKSSYLFNGQGAPDDDESWWDENKWYILAPLLAVGAFTLGGKIQERGRPDKNVWQNIAVNIDDIAKRMNPYDNLDPSTHRYYGYNE